MTMRDAVELVAVMMRWWPHAAERLRAPEVAEGLCEQLHDVAPEHARAAAEAWSRDGHDWPPTAGQLRSRLADLILDAPDWAQVKAQLTGRAEPPPDVPELPDSCPHGVCDGSGLVLDWDTNTAVPCRCRPGRQAIRRARRGHHPLIVEFLRRVGSVEVADLEDRTASAQVRRQWEEFVAGVRRQVTHAGMDGAGLPQLERIAAQRAGAPRRLDPAALIGGGAR